MFARCGTILCWISSPHTSIPGDQRSCHLRRIPPPEQWTLSHFLGTGYWRTRIPHRTLTECPGESPKSTKLTYSHCPKLASAFLVSGPAEAVGGQTNLPPGEGQTSLPSLGKEVPPSIAYTTRMACIVSELEAIGFSEATASRVAGPKRPSTRQVYDSKWRSFTSWCGERSTDPLCASIKVITEFLSWLFDSKGFSLQTIKGCRSAIARTLGHLALRKVGTFFIHTFIHTTMGLERGSEVSVWTLLRTTSPRRTQVPVVEDSLPASRGFRPASFRITRTII